MNQNIFKDKQHFRNSFEQGLVQLLDSDELGVFILVLANASFDQHVHDYTEKALLNKYKILKAHYCESMNQGIILNDPEDDLFVFLKLLAVSIENIKQTTFRNESHWELQFNHIRSFKPPRISQHQFSGIKIDINPDDFNFNKPFLQKEMFWEGTLLEHNSSIFYNKFPFARFHSLLVPDKEKLLPQYLTEEYHQYVWNVTQHLCSTLPGIGLAFNSYGASASINHLHFHLFIKDHPLPITHKDWVHNGGKENYPVLCKTFSDRRSAWSFISQLHQQQIAYNLIYQKNIVYCIIRKHQSNITLPSWSSGMGWYEMSGGFTTFNYDDFTKINLQALNKALSALKIDIN